MSGTVLLALRILLAAALYAFLFLALWLMWRDLRRSTRQLAGPDLPVLSLIRLGAENARRFRSRGPEIIVGRDPTCSLRLDDKTISARHARLSHHHSQWWLEDLQSTNGTFLNAEMVDGAVVVASGDRVRFGELEFEINIEQ
jgi:pSer/pThr/pTyr-binding forkhead associated (FHA) protein